MIERFKVWLCSKSWFWKLRQILNKLSFTIDREIYKKSSPLTKFQANAHILGSFAWIGLKSLFWVVSLMIVLRYAELYGENNFSWFPQLTENDKSYRSEQLQVYAQLLTAIFSIYFATIGIILSTGHAKLRKDIIQLLTNEQIGSFYSKILVLSAIFCLTATATPLFGFEPGLLIYSLATLLTLLSALALFPLGQRLFNFFDLSSLLRSEILPSIANNINNVANQRISQTLANHHSTLARRSFEQLTYIDDHIKSSREELKHSLPALSLGYRDLLLHYLAQKHKIDHESYWFPRRRKYKQWFLAGDSATSIALTTSDQRTLIEESIDYHWLENQIIDRFSNHIELAFKTEDLDLVLDLLTLMSARVSGYSSQFQHRIGFQELKKSKRLIEKGLEKISDDPSNDKTKTIIAIADTWATLGSNLCFETLRRMMTFEPELKHFFKEDHWTKKSLRKLPAFLQVELAFIVERIEFETSIEGRRLSKPKYVQQLAIQKLLDYYSKVLPAISDFYKVMLPDFVKSLSKLKMSEAATQVLLGSLHSHWKLPRWLTDVELLLKRYQTYGHYPEKQYELKEIDTSKILDGLSSSREEVIAMLADGAMIKHVFERKHNDELPDHFGQIYFELAEACISALRQNDDIKLNKILPMFLTLALLAADWRFSEPSLEVSDEFRLHLVSTAINDLASVLGFSILYGEYFGNPKLSQYALSKFKTWISQAANKQQYLKRMILLSNTRSFSMSASPRELIRINWKSSFEELARQDGFSYQYGMGGEKEHPNRLVRVFLNSHSDASHLFFVKEVIPLIKVIDFELDHSIKSLERDLNDNEPEV